MFRHSVKALLCKLQPTSLVSQMVCAITIALVLGQLVSLWILSSAHMDASWENYLETISNQIVNRVKALEKTSPENYSKVLGTPRGFGLEFSMFKTNPLPRQKRNKQPHHVDKASEFSSEKQSIQIYNRRNFPEKHIAQTLRQKLGSSYRHKVIVQAKQTQDTVALNKGINFLNGLSTENADQQEYNLLKPSLTHLEIAIQLASGYWLYGTVTPPLIYPLIAKQTLITLIFSFVFIWLSVVFMVRRIVRPLHLLTTAAEELGRGIAVESIPVKGSCDIKKALAAFNSMNERLQRFVQERTIVLAALTHDLRTPLTTLQLRVDLLDESEEKRMLQNTVEEMRQMMEATLTFARNASGQEKTQRLDISALVGSICEDLKLHGLSVKYREHQRVIILGRVVGLKRAIENIIKNSAVYGHQAAVWLEANNADVLIHVDDQGKGIPEALRKKVFEPFFRLESSRNRHTGGIGLGLAISRDIIAAHGGTIEFSNIKAGFKTLVKLPVSYSS